MTKKSIVREIEAIEDGLTRSFKNVKADINYILSRVQLFENIRSGYFILLERFNKLEEELATNGVVRDLRKLQKEHAELLQQNSDLYALIETRFAELDSNGVATAINRLNAEVFNERKEKRDGYGPGSLVSMMLQARGMEHTPQEEATLAGKVEALIQHAGVDVSVKPKQVIEAKVEAKKKPATKKKGRR